MIYLLSNQSYDGVINLPSIKIEFIQKPIELDVDYLLFTSKNGVIGLDQNTDNWQKIPALCIGEATANKVKELGGEVRYVAKKNYGDEFAKEIITHIPPSRILFPKAKEIVSDIVNILQNANFLIKEEVVYHTICNTISSIPDEGIFIFTSPSTVKCFLKQVTWKDTYQAIAIGEKTAQAFPHQNIIVSATQSITACIKIAKNLLQTQKR
ncbi:MAG: uroporphyrinogen-III synthase [Epsilonproteobacteria bacterium]|nr:uroporphyrinogen-III synthase [Campylobacterota bacterium]